MYRSAFIVAPGFSFCHLSIVFMLQSKAMPYSWQANSDCLPIRHKSFLCLSLNRSLSLWIRVFHNSFPFSVYLVASCYGISLPFNSTGEHIGRVALILVLRVLNQSSISLRWCCNSFEVSWSISIRG